MLEKLEPKDWLSLNAKLQKKKSSLRAALAEKGILKREGNNTFDKYSYFSEAQYKALFTKLFSTHGLELSFSEVSYDVFDGTEKQSNGRLTRLEFALTDTETGFFETTVITGEGIDKGDKAGYKAFTGALKYYLANTFLVATGDDPEKESPEVKTPAQRTASPKQIEMLKKLLNEEQVGAMLKYFNVSKIEELTVKQASEIIAKKGGKE